MCKDVCRSVMSYMTAQHVHCHVTIPLAFGVMLVSHRKSGHTQRIIRQDVCCICITCEQVPRLPQLRRQTLSSYATHSLAVAANTEAILTCLP